MKFRTIVQPEKAGFSISHKQKILSIGSCFAENIGQQLESRKFDILLNPFGITYNPIAISNSLDILKDKRLFSSKDLMENEGIWFSLDHHSHFSTSSSDATLKIINRNIEAAHNKLKDLNVLILTLGTAHVFQYKQGNRIVNNCHKLPASSFERSMLSVKEIVENLSVNIESLTDVSPDLKIIITVSPVRHLRDGLIESKQSKAVLLLVAHELCQSFTNVNYYPAYEILLDDLRDYRFYNADLVHPSEEAIQYVWEHFSETYFNQDTAALNQSIEKLNAAINHRPFFPDSEKHKTFLKSHLAKAKKMKQEFPFLKLEKEITYFS